MIAGAVRHPLRSFSPFDAAGGISWGVYTALVGYVGGSAFEDDPLLGLALGLGLALTLAGLVEAVRHRLRTSARVNA